MLRVDVMSEDWPESMVKNLDRVIAQVKSKKDEPSIVGPDKDLIAGNTRAMVRRSMNRPVKALVIPK